MTILSALQQTAVGAAISIATLQIVLDAANVDLATRTNAIQVAMLGLGVMTALQCLRIGRVGSGYLVPAVFATAYLPGAVAAAEAGGLGLVFGMTAFAGLVMMALSYAVPRLRPFFPTEITGFVVFSIGLGMGTIGMHAFGRHSERLHGALTMDLLETEVGLALIALMMALTIWSTGAAKTFSVVIGILFGYGLAAATGFVSWEAVDAAAASAGFVDPPVLMAFWPAFDIAYAMPFAVGALACCLRSIGDVTTAQKLNDAGWVRPDLRSIEGGILASGLGSLVAGLIGTIGGNTASSGVGLSGTTGITSRVVGYAIAAMFVSLSFLPWVSAVLAVMPQPIIGAVLIFTGCMVIINGIQIMASRVLDQRKTFIIGMATILGLSVEINPGFFAAAPVWMKPLLQSTVVISIFAALALNALFRLGVRKTATLTIAFPAGEPRAAARFLERQGGLWGARQDVMHRAVRAIGEFDEIGPALVRPGGCLSLTASYDEYKLVVTAAYPGRPLDLTARPMSTDEVMAADEGEAQLRLAGVIMADAADRLQVQATAERHQVRFEFDH